VSATEVWVALAACRGVGVVHGRGRSQVLALDEVDLDIGDGETLALWGRSGSGKTTLLHVLGGLLTPSTGEVRWRGAPLSTLESAARAALRARGIAYVFQGAHLLPHFSAYENVAFAAWASGRGEDAESPPEDLLGLVGLAAKLDALPGELSGGEAQRVAIARALAQRPDLLLCDEPTGHLDSDTGERVLGLIEALQRERGFALVIATHDADVAARCARVLELRDGRLAAGVAP
jgi:predicted ABC-type transport system involved in lysophospholipase L1 biosynthesis ATPase subunit